MTKKQKRPIDPADQKAIDEYNDIAKWNLHVAKEKMKNASGLVKESIKHILHGGKFFLDAVDRSLGAKIAPPNKRAAVNLAKNNLIKMLLATGMIAGGANITKDTIEKYQNNKDDKEETEQYIEHIGKLGFNYVGTEGKKDIFTYIVKEGDTPYGISKNFNTNDDKNNDQYKEIGYDNISDEDGKEGKELKLVPGDKVTIYARLNTGKMQYENYSDTLHKILKENQIKYKSEIGDKNIRNINMTKYPKLLKKYSYIPIISRYHLGIYDDKYPTKKEMIMLEEYPQVDFGLSLQKFREKKFLKHGSRDFRTKGNNKEFIDFEKINEIKLDDVNYCSKYPVEAGYVQRAKSYVLGENKATRISLDGYIKYCSHMVNTFTDDEVNNYSGGLSGNKLEFFKKIKENLRGEHIASYAMTEILESHDGENNVQFLSYILENGGLEYLGAIPSLGDGKSSLGLFQFTEYAMYNSNGRTRGASTVDKFSSKEFKLPGSVIYLNINDQHQAAIYFFLNNVASLLYKLSDQEFKSLDTKMNEDPQAFMDSFIQFAGMSHNSPTRAASAIKSRIKSGYRNDIYFYGVSSLQQNYGKKTRNNCLALQNYKK